MRKADLLKMIDTCVELCQEEQKAGYPGEATEVQVEKTILPEMNELKKCIICDEIPKERYILSFWSAFKCWDWDMRNASKLYLSLLALDEAYRDFKAE